MTYWRALCVPLGMATLVQPAMAQTDSGGALALEEIVVTAQRRTENLQDVPIQVAAFNERSVIDAGIRETRDFVDLVPNVSLDDSDTYHNTFVVVRGVTQINNADAPVAIVIDGVAQNNQKQFKMNLFDIERIEVLKGPQGALYGRNAIGGAINIVTRQPTDEFEGNVRTSYGDGGALDLSASISGPISEDIASFRLTGSYLQDDGRINDTFVGTEADYIDHDYSIRGQLRLVPTDGLTLDFRASHNDFKAGSQWDTPVFSGNANDFAEPERNMLGETTGSVNELTFKFDADLGVGTLTGITGYTDLEEINRGDLDFRNPVDSPGGFFGLGIQLGQGQDLLVEMLSQELRLASPSSQRLRWIVGAYYINTDKALRTRGFVDLDGSFGQIENPALLLIDRQESNDNDAYAVFTQLDYDFTDELTLSTALRYDRDAREQADLSSGAVREEEFDAVQPKLTLAYKFDDDRLGYFTYSEGFRSGGFNAPGIPADRFDDENLANYEIGVKTSWLDRRLIVNSAFFFTQVEDFQFFFVDAISAAQIIQNIDDVDIFGFELDAQYLLSEGLHIYGGLGTTNSEIKAITVFPGNEGNKTPKTTDVSLNLGLQYRREMANGTGLFARFDYEHRGHKYWHVDNQDVQDPLDFLNARIGIETDQWGVYLWGKNVTDEEYYTDFNPTEFSGLDVDIGYLGRPRTYGIEASYRF